MKKLLLFLLIAVMSMVWQRSVAFSFSAENNDGVTIFYNLINDGNQVEVTYETNSYNSYSGDVNIPSTVTYNERELPVTSIGNSAFRGCSGLTSVTIPDGVTSIGNSAFRYCSSLTSVNIPEGVTSIAYNTFESCSSLTSVSIPSSVSSIGQEAFVYCSGLTSVTIEEGVSSIGNYAFRCCSSLTSVTIPSSVISIGEYAFGGCSGLTSVTIEEGVTSIGYSAFDGCSGLRSVSIPSSVTSISSSTFFNCYNLTSVTIPSSVTSIGSYAFYYCSSLTSVTIPSSVTSIGPSAFRGCTGLTSVTIPSSVTSIDECVFSGCTGLTSVTIEEGVTSIGYSAFSGCSGLTSVTIPSSVTRIVSYAFDSCSGLTSVTIPSSVTSIDEYAFDSCSGLTSVTIEEGVTSIGPSAFRGCSGLTSVTIPSSVTSIDEYAFSGCSILTTITMEGAAPTLGNSSTIPNQTIIVVPADELTDYQTASIWSDMASRIIAAGTTIDYDVTLSAQTSSSALHAAIGEENLMKVVSLKVSGTINSYDIMIMRNKMLNLRHLDLSDASIVANSYEYYSGCHSEDNKLGDNMFRDLKLGSFKAPRTATAMGTSVFQGCSSLYDVTLYEGLTNIGDHAFNGCGIGSMTVPSSVTVIGEYAFSGCTRLQEISLPDGMTDIGSFAFQNCQIREITIPEGVKRLHSHTFCGPRGYDANGYLKTVHLPSTLEVIEELPFSGYYSDTGTNALTELILPAGLKRIQGSLGYNSIITELRLPPMLEYVAGGVFQGYSGIKDYYVYVVDPININMSSFANYTTATLHVPTQSYQNYYWNTQWSQFANLVEFDEPYERFYLQNDYTLEEDKRFDGEPDADFHSGSGFIVEGGDNQALDEVHVVGDGTDAASVIDEGNVTVNSLYFDIEIQANRWYFFAFPFRVKVSDIVAPGYYALRWYDAEERAQNGQGGWKDFEGEYLEPGIGYIFQCNTSGTLNIPTTNPTFDGQDIDSELVSNPSSNTQHASWNFIGNPWLSYFDINDCEFDAPFTIWNGSGYDAYRPGDDDYLLHPFQAFFVQMFGGNNGLHFGSGDRYTYHQGQNHQQQAHARRMAKGINPARLMLNLTISDGTNTDRTRVVFNAEKQNVYELGTDAAKFMTATMPQLFTLDGTNVRYAINERPAGEVRLGYNAPAAGTYTIAQQRMDQPMLLRDLQTGTTTDLTEKDYTFDSEAGMFDNRFMLVMDQTATGIAQLFTETGVSVIAADGGLYISGADGSDVSIYNTAGMMMTQRAANGHMALPRGTYIITVNGVSTKVAVR